MPTMTEQEAREKLGEAASMIAELIIAAVGAERMQNALTMESTARDQIFRELHEPEKDKYRRVNDEIRAVLLKEGFSATHASMLIVLMASGDLPHVRVDY